MSILIDNLEDAKSFSDNKTVLLYSGGLDSMYTALYLKKNGFDITALLLDVGQRIHSNIYTNAEKIGIKLKIVKSKEKLFKDFISKGILANALYNGNYPLSSSYTRPLMASEACKLAREIGCRLIVHSSTPFQNSANRFNLSIISQAPDIGIFCPALVDCVTREDKMKELERYGIIFSSKSIYSVDENLWARVIENGSLEKPWIEIPISDVFKWTKNPEESEKHPLYFTLEFKRGLPFSINGEKKPLYSITDLLNKKLGAYGIGRFSGLENGHYGFKNHEIRESPAAEIMHRSHIILEEMILSSSERRVKNILDREWTELAVFGGWFSPLKENIEKAIIAFNQDISGSIKWRVSSGNIFCVSKVSNNSLITVSDSCFINEFNPYTIDSLTKQLARKYRLY